ncbi:LANO_0F08130g1_1 [Lachancea nothofagi CBS 11611]|uniref:LANO_0F08130g1_1 n=1 Tax=Lachancea nothofagi CBS 11611 TaxID=1266666 RepID=A0A1G4K9B9_9SACH|nr:LANO_0F08130g1_1 [Lachancea nothofagi CBS 11611]
MERVAGCSQSEVVLVKNALKNWHIKELLKLQIELTQEIEERVGILLNDQTSVNDIKSDVGVSHLKRERDSSQELPVECGVKDESLGALLEDKVDENNELPLTQIEKKQKLQNAEQSFDPKSSQPAFFDEFLIPGTLDMQSKEIDFSSPLKVVGLNDARLQKSSPIKRKLAVISDSEGDLDWSDTEERKSSNAETPTTRIDERTSNTVKLDLNENPFTKKPWIYEDFKLNEIANNAHKGRLNVVSSKLSKFHSAAGKPPQKQKLVLHPDRGFEFVTEDDSENEVVTNDDQDDQFANLRQRSKSPPGFGRLDFPNTQENMADMTKSREILYNKTRHRFLTATRSDLPPSKRQFLFRNIVLNNVVNEGNFEWDPSHLQIFSRARIRN